MSVSIRKIRIPDPFSAREYGTRHVEDLGAQIALRQLSARFRQETGMTLSEYVLHEKTEEAKRLLRYSDRSAAAIGAFLGFSSHGHFIRVFKKATGLTPGEYREKHGR